MCERKDARQTVSEAGKCQDRREMKGKTKKGGKVVPVLGECDERNA